MLKISQVLAAIAILVSFHTPIILSMEEPATRLRTESEEIALAWGLSERQGKRLTMEDTFTFREIELEPDAQKAYYFGLFDGHGGAAAADFAAANAIDYFLAAFHANQTETNSAEKIEAAFITSYHNLDTEIQKICFHSGTTALSALILGQDLYLAWAGDSRALVMDQNGEAKQATNDHKPDSVHEKWRIMRTGQYISPAKTTPGSVARVGDLAVSRALGDKISKARTQPHAIIATPEIIHERIEKGQHIILGCDGLWDVVDNHEACNYVRVLQKNDSTELDELGALPHLGEKQASAGNDARLIQIARILRDRAYSKQSMDNISVMIIQIK